jgi:hypothetical protein
MKIAFGVITFEDLLNSVRRGPIPFVKIGKPEIEYEDAGPEASRNPIDRLHIAAFLGNEWAIANFLTCMSAHFGEVSFGGTAKVPFPDDWEARKTELFSRLNISDPEELKIISEGTEDKLLMATRYFMRRGSYAASMRIHARSWTGMYSLDKLSKSNLESRIESIVKAHVSYLPKVKKYFPYSEIFE